MQGPETQTICERLIGNKIVSFRVRILVPAIFLGYASSNFGEAVLPFLLWTGLGYWMFYCVRFIRTRVVLAEKSISPLCPNGEEGFHQVFHGLTKPVPQLMAILVIASLDPLYFYRLLAPSGFLSHAVAIAAFLLWGLVWGTVNWLYLRSLKGLYDLGRQPLKLRSYFRDPMMGVKPFGSLSLNLAFAFISLPTLGTIASYFYATIFTTFFNLAFALLGIVMFFIPLFSVHQKLVLAKEEAYARVNGELEEHMKSEPRPPKESDGSLARIEKTMALDLEERKVNSIHTWPLDAEIVRKFSAVTISVLVTLLAQTLVIILNLH